MLVFLAWWVGICAALVAMWCGMIRIAEWRGRRVHTRAIDITGAPFPDIRYQRDEGDEDTVATEGLGVHPSPRRVRDGWLLTLGELHDAEAEAVFGAARRAS